MADDPLAYNQRGTGFWTTDFVREIVRQTHLPNGILISTVFLRYTIGAEREQYYETMALKGRDVLAEFRAHDWDEALAQHNMLANAKFPIGPEPDEPNPQLGGPRKIIV
jgi:hypothetical protein